MLLRGFEAVTGVGRVNGLHRISYSCSTHKSSRKSAVKDVLKVP